MQQGSNIQIRAQSSSDFADTKIHASEISINQPSSWANRVGPVTAVVGAFGLIFTMHQLGTIANSGSYIVSYLRVKSPYESDHGLNTAAIMWIGTVYTLTSGFGGVLGGFIERRWSARVSCSIGSLIYSSSIATSGLMLDWGFLATLVTFGALSGVGCGITWTPAMVNAFKWYNKTKRGIVSGIAMSSVGFGSLLFTYMQTYWVNPSNLSPDDTGFFTEEQLLARVPSMCWLMGATSFAIQVFSLILMSHPPNSTDAEQTKQSDQQATTITQSLSDSNLRRTQTSLTSLVTTVYDEHSDNLAAIGVRQIIMSRQFLVLFIFSTLFAPALVFIHASIKQFGTAYIKDDHLLSWCTGASSAGFVVGKIFWGWTVDTVGYVKCVLVGGCVLIAGMLLFPTELVLRHKYVYAAFTFAINTSTIAFAVASNVHLSGIYGSNNTTLAIALLSISSFINFPATVLIGWQLSAHSRYAPCLTMSVWMAVALVILLAYTRYYGSRSWILTPNSNAVIRNIN